MVNKTKILVPMSLQSSEEDETLYYTIAKIQNKECSLQLERWGRDGISNGP